jgi:hypothetical protein
MQRLAELFNVNHFIVSQVNPHARVLGQTHGWNSVSLAVKGGFEVAQYQLAKLTDFFKAQAKAYVGNLLKLMTATPLKPLGFSIEPLITQKYEGDITILPAGGAHGSVWVMQLASLLKNPTPAEVRGLFTHTLSARPTLTLPTLTLPTLTLPSSPRTWPKAKRPHGHTLPVSAWPVWWNSHSTIVCRASVDSWRTHSLGTVLVYTMLSIHYTYHTGACTR